jgi:hypothetical protein
MLSISTYGKSVGYQIAWVALDPHLPARVYRDQEPVGWRVVSQSAGAPDFWDRKLPHRPRSQLRCPLVRRCGFGSYPTVKCPPSDRYVRSERPLNEQSSSPGPARRGPDHDDATLTQEHLVIPSPPRPATKCDCPRLLSQVPLQALPPLCKWPFSWSVDYPRSDYL